jgi:hypothetical protein
MTSFVPVPGPQLPPAAFNHVVRGPHDYTREMRRLANTARRMAGGRAVLYHGTRYRLPFCELASFSRQVWERSHLPARQKSQHIWHFKSDIPTRDAAPFSYSIGTHLDADTQLYPSMRSGSKLAEDTGTMRRRKKCGLTSSTLAAI